jgi:hypothetical protein
VNGWSGTRAARFGLRFVAIILCASRTPVVPLSVTVPACDTTVDVLAKQGKVSIKVKTAFADVNNEKVTWLKGGL